MMADVLMTENQNVGIIGSCRLESSTKYLGRCVKRTFLELTKHEIGLLLADHI